MEKHLDVSATSVTYQYSLRKIHTLCVRLFTFTGTFPLPKIVLSSHDIIVICNSEFYRDFKVQLYSVFKDNKVLQVKFSVFLVLTLEHLTKHSNQV